MTRVTPTNTSSVEEAGFLRIRYDRIVRFKEQPRTHFSEESICELADSIEAEGQNTPVQVCKGSGGKKSKVNIDTDGNPLFTLIDGERRWRACTLLSERTGKPFLMKATIEIVDSVEEHFRRSFGANFGREDMTPLDIAAGLQRLRDGGATHEELAKSYSKSVAYVINYLSLHKLPDQVKDMMSPSVPKAQRLGVTHAVQIARVRDPSTQLQLAEEAVEMGLSVADLRMSVDGKGLSKRDHTPYNTDPYQPRSRRASDERAILTNLIKNTAKSLGRTAARIESGDLDIEDVYLSAADGDEVFEDYSIQLRSIEKSFVTIKEAINDLLEK